MNKGNKTCAGILFAFLPIFAVYFGFIILQTWVLAIQSTTHKTNVINDTDSDKPMNESKDNVVLLIHLTVVVCLSVFGICIALHKYFGICSKNKNYPKSFVLASLLLIAELICIVLVWRLRARIITTCLLITVQAMNYIIIPTSCCVYVFMCNPCKRKAKAKIKKVKAKRQMQKQLKKLKIKYQNKSIWYIEAPNDNAQQHSGLTRLIERDTATFDYVEGLMTNTWVYDNQSGRDAWNLTHSAIRVKYVIQIKNTGLYQTFQENETSSVSENVKDFIMTLSTTKETKEFLDRQNKRQIPDNIRSLENDEVLLFHGTDIENIGPIINNGFDINKCVRSCYGRGMYFAESSQKSDQYTDNASNRRSQDLSMLIVRVRLGNILNRETTPDGNVEGVDTVIAGHNARFREFVALNTDNLYPEFQVIYDRV